MALKCMFLCLLFLVVAGCAPRQPRLGEPVTNATPVYSFVKVGELYHLLAPAEAGIRSGIQAICGSHICHVQRVGEVYVVEVTP